MADVLEQGASGVPSPDAPPDAAPAASPPPSAAGAAPDFEELTATDAVRLEKRKKKAERMRVRRRLSKLEKAGNDDELRAMMREELGPVTEPSTLPPSELEQVRPSKVSPEDLASAKALALELWCAVGAVLDTQAPAWRITRPEAETLAGGFAPLLAKYLPKLDNSPEASAIVCTLLVFGPKAINNLRAPASAPMTAATH